MESKAGFVSWLNSFGVQGYYHLKFGCHIHGSPNENLNEVLSIQTLKLKMYLP